MIVQLKGIDDFSIDGVTSNELKSIYNAIVVSQLPDRRELHKFKTEIEKYVQ